ncbi:MAG: T9SS type A sorting domain-containing protein [Saprospiraceae bacterium]|nr:T9SS type A sorting domain-containing protein [Saprospiraceae bacterium]
MKSILTLFSIVLFQNIYAQPVKISRIAIDPGANSYQLIDMNNDNLPDIVNTGMFWDVEVFLNKGNFEFSYIDVSKDPGAGETFSNQLGFIDFDNDGDKDIVHTNCPACGDNGVNLYLNENFRSFNKKLTIASNPGSSIIYDAFDINKDGREDLIVCGDKTYYYLNNNGTGFSTGYALSPNIKIDYIHHQDLNNDGWKDVVARSSKDTYIYINNNGVFAAGIKLTNYDLSGYVNTKDINKDGILDYYTTSTFCLKVMLSNKSKADFFEPVMNILCTNVYDTKFDLVDIDGDSELDIIHGKNASDGIYFRINNGNGYEASKLLNHAGFQQNFYITADFNNDGREDILMKDKWTMLGIFENKYDETNAPLHIVGETLRDFQIGDLDNDGQQDILSYYDEWIGINYIKDNQYLGLKTIFRTPAKTNINEVVIFDIDKDNDNDIIISLNPDVALGSRPTLIWLENINNNFSKANTILNNIRDIGDIALGDFNKDGHKDMVLTRNNSSGIYLKNNGNGTFTSKDFYGTGRESLVIDLNKDGFDDVISWRGNGDIIYYSENDKSGEFKTRKNLAAYSQIHDVKFYDFDFEGDLDLVANVYQNSTSNLVIHFNEALTFTKTKTITTNYTGTCLELAFETGNTKPFIITGGYLDLYKLKDNGDFEFIPGKTPLYTYSIFKRILIDNSYHLLASGGENNGYLMDIEGFRLNTTSVRNTYQEPLIVYPNPASDLINVSGDNLRGYRIIDIYGNHIFGSDQSTIDLNPLPSGIYFIITIDGRSAKFTKI